MYHIVFQHADVTALSKSFELDPTMQGEIIEICDDFAVGPIGNLFAEDGIAARNRWWTEVLAGGDSEGLVLTGKVNDPATIASLKQKLEKQQHEVVWIWAAQNKHDVSGYYWLISQLKEYCGRIYILYLNNLPFINEKGNIFYPLNLFQISAREFVKARKLARPVTPGEFEVDGDEWIRLSNEEKSVRLLEGGKKLVQADEDYYDHELAAFITTDWQKAGRIIHHFLHKAKITTGDAFLLWRLKLILTTGEYEVQGQPKGMKDFEIKVKTPQTENIPR